MIQLSTVPTKTLEIRGSNGRPAERDGDFASKLDKKLSADDQSSGKILPEDGKELPAAATAGRKRTDTAEMEADATGDADIAKDTLPEAEILSEIAGAAMAKSSDNGATANSILQVSVKLTPDVAALPVDAAPGAAAEEAADPVLEGSGARNSGLTQAPHAKAEGPGRGRALLTQLTEATEQLEIAPEKSATPELKPEANQARPRIPRELGLEIAKGAREAKTLEAPGSRGMQASSIVLPITPAMNPQVAETPSLSPGTRQLFDAASVQHSVRPQDFSALVDRLVEARESARGGSVNLSVMHADFGEVSLKFNHDNGNLSVAMASRDPEFARAVTAATPADGSQTSETPFQGGRREEGTGASSSRSDGGANASTQGERHGQGKFTNRDVDAQTETLAKSAGMAGRDGRGGIYA